MGYRDRSQDANPVTCRCASQVTISPHFAEIANQDTASFYPSMCVDASADLEHILTRFQAHYDCSQGQYLLATAPCEEQPATVFLWSKRALRKWMH